MASGQNEILSKAEDIADKVSQSRMFCEGMLKVTNRYQPYGKVITLSCGGNLGDAVHVGSNVMFMK